MTSLDSKRFCSKEIPSVANILGESFAIFGPKALPKRLFWATFWKQLRQSL